MRRIVRHRPSPAMVIACIALTIALGGTSYAAVALPRNSVGTAQLKRNAVNSAKVRNFSLLRVDFKRGQLPAGPRGLQGVQGAQGLKGDKGDRGDTGPAGPFPDPLQSGKTIRGAWNMVTAANQTFTQTAQSFVFTLPGDPDGHVILNGVPNPNPQECPGTVANPQAAPGEFCLYVTTRVNTGGPSICNPTQDLCGIDPSPYGFFLQMSPTNAAQSSRTHGTWAATAP